MSLFRRPLEERSLTGGDWFIKGGSDPMRRGEGQALSLAPVYASVRHIVDYVSTLPMDAFRKDGDARTPMPLPPVFASLERRGQLIPWLGQLGASLAIHGNAVGLTVRASGYGLPEEVVWLPMTKVVVDDSTGSPRWFYNGRELARTDVLHIPWLTVPGQTLGLSPVEYFAETIGAGIAAQKFGADVHASGGFPPAVLRNTAKRVGPEESKAIRERLKASMRKREPLVTGSDWEFTAVTIPPNQAQFIEAQKMTASQVAAIFGIDPVEIGGEAANSLTYSTEELRQINRAANMRPWLTRIERAFGSWLPERQFVKFNTDATIRTDIKTRHEVYEIQRRIGLLSLNEQRELEDRPPVKGGDTHVPAPVQDQQPAEGARLSLIPKENA